MEAKTEQKKLIVLKKPQGEISIYASDDDMSAGQRDVTEVQGSRTGG